MINPAEGSKKKVPEWLNAKNIVRYGLMGIGLVTLAPAFKQISTQSGNYYSDLLHLNEVITANPAGNYVLNTINELTHIFSSAIPQYHPDDVPMIHIMEFFHTLAIIGGPLEHVLENIFTSKREARKLAGVEPLRKKEIPEHVFIGPSLIVSDLANKLFENRKKRKHNPIIGIHTDQSIPARFGQEIDYHFAVDDAQILLGTFPTKDDRLFTEVSGIDRAKEITIVCFNPDNAIFYGNQNEADIPPDFASSLIRSIRPPEKLNGKKINVIFNDTKLLAGSTPIEKELIKLSQENHFTLNCIKPEELVITRIKSEIDDLKITGTKKVALVGQGEQDKDKLMLRKFTKTVQDINSDIEVEFISNEQAMQGSFGDHDLYICYGDTDLGTSSLAEAVNEKLEGKTNKSKIFALVERNKSLQEYEQIKNVTPVSIYQLVVDKILEISK